MPIIRSAGLLLCLRAEINNEDDGDNEQGIHE